jgi:transcriptional regulator with XRE-family HTH domain
MTTMYHYQRISTNLCLYADTVAVLIRSPLMRSDTAISASLIKQARMRAGLSQAQVAERSGKAKVQIGRWETGDVAPSLDTLMVLVRACGFDLRLTLVSYEPVDDARLLELQRQSPEDRVERMLRRGAEQGEG